MNILNFITEPNAVIDWQLFEHVYPEIVKSLTNTPQDKFHHSEGNVWVHTKMVVDSLISTSEWRSLSAMDQRILFCAALFHDIAKPLCTTYLENERISSPGHSKKGAIDARLFFWKEQFTFYERETISRLIGVHQKPFFVMNKEDPILEIRTLSREVPLNLLFLLARADGEGRYTTPPFERQKTLDHIDYAQMLAEDENIYNSPFEPADEDTWLKYLNRAGKGIDPRYALYQELPPFEVIVMSGLPGMGKDTWISKHAHNLPVVSYDATREILGFEYGDEQGQLASIVKEQAKSYLRQRQPFIWNATHISPSMRQKTLGLLHSYGAYVRIVYIEAKDEITWRSQNRSREASVPNKALYSMLFKWEVPLENEAHCVEYIVDNKNISINRITTPNNVFDHNL